MNEGDNLSFHIVDIGGDEPIAEIKEAHYKALQTLNDKLSTSGQRIINGLYIGEAGLHGDLGSWANSMDEYISGLEGVNPFYTKSRVLGMLQLNDSSQSVVESVLKDLGLYRDTLLNYEE